MVVVMPAAQAPPPQYHVVTAGGTAAGQHLTGQTALPSLQMLPLMRNELQYLLRPLHQVSAIIQNGKYMLYNVMINKRPRHPLSFRLGSNIYAFNHNWNMSCRNLRVTFDNKLTMKKKMLHRDVDLHHNYTLHRTGEIRSLIDKQTAERLRSHAFVMCPYIFL